MTETDRSVHLQAWHALLRAQAGVAGNLERELMAAEGLPLAWFEVLLVLDQASDGALRLQRLMDTVLMTKSGPGCATPSALSRTPSAARPSSPDVRA